jgi:hypothetical protein
MEKVQFFKKELSKHFWDATEHDEIAQVFVERFQKYLQEDETFQIDSCVCEGTLQFKITLKNHDNSFIYPIECVAYSNKDLGGLKPELQEGAWLTLAQATLEYVMIYLEEFFEEGRELYLPLDWSHHSLTEETSILLRGFFRNKAIEDLADSLLKEHGNGDHQIYEISSEY